VLEGGSAFKSVDPKAYY
jgi:hypothetical protein